MSEHSFSKGIKADLLKVPVRTREEARAEVSAAFLAAGHPGADVQPLPLYLMTSSASYAERLVGQLRLAGLDALAEKTILAARTRWHVYPLPAGEQTFEEMLGAFLDEKNLDNISSSQNIRRAALRGAFLAAGTMSDPTKAYQAEIAARDRRAAEILLLLLHAENIEPSIVVRNDRPVLYFKEGQAIADFLAATGAHSCLLQFESIRVDKELRNTVNRVVNCDTANARRQAEACARQTELLRLLLESDAGVRLPKELQEAARVRVDNPGMSIRDLGLLMTPPIGKSGMNHRLRKLEEIAMEEGLGQNR